MQLPEQYDDSNFVPDQSFEPLPPGEYAVMVANAELDPTRDGNGVMLKLELQVLDGEPHAGRKVFDRLMLKSQRTDDKMATALRIAAGRLHSIRAALGLGVLNDTEQLVGKSMRVTLKVSPGKGNYNPSNDVQAYKPMGGAPKPAAAPQPQPSSPQPTSQPQPAAAGAAPWAR